MIGSKKSPWTAWTTKDRKVVERWYPLGGTAAVQPRLHRQRSAIAIERAAARFGIRKIPDRSKWIGYRSPRQKLPTEVINALRYERAIAFPGLSVKQIAALLGITERTVQYHIRRGREFPRDEPEDRA